MSDLQDNNFQNSDNDDENDRKKNWRLNWLDSLVALSSPEFQPRWLDRRIGVPAWTFIEFMNGYFDDLGLDYGNDNLCHFHLLTEHM